MPLAVYRRLYESAEACGGGTIVEIGTFRGAATIAMALGAKRAGAPFEIVTADLLRPGIGLEGADPEEKIAALTATFAEFGVAESIRFVHGSCRELAAATDPRDIRLLLLDGGGKIEVDFALLWNRLVPHAAIVIDDIDGAVSVRRSLRSIRVNQKGRISFLLADRFVEAGMLVPIGRTGSTGWYRRGATALSPPEIELIALPAYHELIRVTVGAEEFGLAKAALRRLAARAPWLRNAYRRVRPGR